ncbi:hypothetical protein [Acidovorax sp. SUPP3334]|uniref:hypothetical protein n=1 Tax=Acidovorax sp. SUPP3334 TaxID=2920881 RepID=UPI0023DE4874|nr:hypothetical protein [Acidovorax sp. SUPP3334]GKT21692.1 hypothetical protein AVHM3334_05675 [Acidovorax sp. SUPP3334]
MPLDSNWASVMTPDYVYVGIVKREEFDRIALPETDHGAANPDRPLLTKTARDPSGCTVVFQHWYGPTLAERAAQAAAAEALTRLAAERVPA